MPVFPTSWVIPASLGGTAVMPNSGDGLLIRGTAHSNFIGLDRAGHALPNSVCPSSTPAL